MIKTYEDYVKAFNNTEYTNIVKFKQANPGAYESYTERMKRDNLKRTNPTAYAMQYGTPIQAPTSPIQTPQRNTPTNTQRTYATLDTNKEDRLLRELEELRKI